jgi:uncharacterized phiE125 gp8 family phage protein
MFAVVTPPATEALTVEEAKAFCQLDGTNAEPKPSAITVALAAPPAAGNVDNGAHRYLATFVTASGETEAGVVSAAVTVVDKTVNGKVQLTGIPLGGSAVTSRKIYRTAAGGAIYMLLTTIADNTTTTYTDNTADAGLGVGAPAVNTTGDPLLTIFIAAAGKLAEQELDRALVTRTTDLYLDAFPCEPAYEIRLPPIQSVTSITYTDTAGVAQVLDPAAYTVDAISRPARIVPAYGYSWPTTRAIPNAVKVRFVEGYGAAALVPACVKHWMALHVKAAWDNRDKYQAGAPITKLPNEFVDGMLDPERVHGRLQNA